jgi:hypothetical protein
MDGFLAAEHQLCLPEYRQGLRLANIKMTDSFKWWKSKCKCAWSKDICLIVAQASVPQQQDAMRISFASEKSNERVRFSTRQNRGLHIVLLHG